MRKKILTIAGASGVVGRHIIKYALDHDFNLRVLSRQRNLTTESIQYYTWKPDDFPEIDIEEVVAALDGSDILINLAGVSISEGRYNEKIQTMILQSRLNATDSLIHAYQKCKNPPKIWGQASAVGYYGNTGELDVTEEHPAGNLFLSNVCVQWENKLAQLGKIKKKPKIIIGRFGMVLAKDAPVWKKILYPVVKLGLGGSIGSGSQWYSWIDADDLARAFFYLFEKRNSGGIYNFTSLDPVHQRDLLKKAAQIMHRPSFIHTPKFLIRAVMGKMADELILSSCRAIPEKLNQSGFKFQYPDMETELHNLLVK